MARVLTWVRLCAATAVLAAAAYWLFNTSMVVFHAAPVYKLLAAITLPGFLAGIAASGNVHDGFGTGLRAIVLTGVCSGIVWGTSLFLLMGLPRVVKRGLLGRA
jgi:hypothetical protein